MALIKFEQLNTSLIRLSKILSLCDAGAMPHLQFGISVNLGVMPHLDFENLGVMPHLDFEHFL